MRIAVQTVLIGNFITEQTVQIGAAARKRYGSERAMPRNCVAKFLALYADGFLSWLNMALMFACMPAASGSGGLQASMSESTAMTACSAERSPVTLMAPASLAMLRSTRTLKSRV